MDDLCRLCKSKSELLNVFDPRIGNIKDVVKIASGVEILETDDISQKVCLQCCLFSVKVFHFHRKSSMINQELMDAYNKRKQQNLLIVPNKKDNIDNNNTKNNNIDQTTNVENRKKPIKYHSSIIQMKKKYSNLKFPRLKPDSDFLPFITLLTNEVSDWYNQTTLRKDMIFQVDENSVERPRTPQSVVHSSSQNKKIEETKCNGIGGQNKPEEILIEKKEVDSSRMITKQNSSSNTIEEKEAIIVKGKKQMECQTVEKGANIRQIHNKEDLKRKKSNENIVSNKKTKSTENYNATTVDKSKSGTQIQSQKDILEKVSDGLTIEKQRDNKLHKIDETMETNTNDIQCKTTELMQKKKNEIQKQSSTTKIENETSVQMNKKEACESIPEKENHDNVVQQMNETTIKKHEVDCGQLIVNQSNSKRTQRNSDELLKQKKLHGKATETEKVSRETTEHNPTMSEETHTKIVQKMANESEKSLTEVNAIKLKEASAKKRSTDMIQSTESLSSKKIRISKEACQPSTTNPEEILRKICETSPDRVILQKVVSPEQNRETLVEPANDKPKEAVINISRIREVLKGKFRGCSSPEKMQMVDARKKQQKVVEENNVNVVPSSLSNNSNKTNKLENISNSNQNKIDFVESLNLMPCSEKAEHKTYTNHEILSLHFVKYCCQYCNASHSTLKSLKAHEKKYHTSCLFCSHHIENIEDRKKHMLFYCPKRTIKIPKVMLIKVDKQKQIVAKYASSFFSLNSDHKESSSDPIQNTKKPTVVERDTFINLQSSEIPEKNPVKSECDIPDHKPIFNIPVYNETNTMDSRNLKEIYNTIKNRTLYILDSIVEDPINREYHFKKLSPELCFHKVNIALTHGKGIHMKFDSSKNLPFVTNKRDFWDNETVRCPIQEVPTQSHNMEITVSSNQQEKCKENIKISKQKKMWDQHPHENKIAEKVNTSIKTNTGNKIGTKRLTIGKKITKSMQNGLGVPTQNLGSKVPPQRINADTQVIQNMVNETPVETPNINSGVQCQTINSEKQFSQNKGIVALVQKATMNRILPQKNIVENQLIENKGNPAPFQRAPMGNEISKQRTNIDKQKILNKPNETLALVHSPSTSGILPHQPKMGKEVTPNMRDKAPSQQSNMAKNITENMNSGPLTQVVNMKHKLPTSDVQKQSPSRTINLPVTSQTNERLLISNSMVNSRPPTTMQSTQFYYPFLVNGQNIILITQQQEQQNTPLVLLQAINNRPANILLNSSFQIPSASVSSMLLQSPSTSVMSSNVE